MSVSQNSGTASWTPAERKERVKLLKSLHRPLEEHWASRKDCDAAGSDYTYKHHITRLDGIYTNTELNKTIDNAEPQQISNVSPMQQLYGPDGVAYELSNKQIQNREQSWDKYHTTLPQRLIPDRISVIRSPSPTARRVPGQLQHSTSTTSNSNSISSGAVPGSGSRESYSRDRDRDRDNRGGSSSRASSPISAYRGTSASSPTGGLGVEGSGERGDRRRESVSGNGNGSGSRGGGNKKEKKKGAKHKMNNNVKTGSWQVKGSGDVNRNRTDDQVSARSDLILAGVYRLSPPDEHVYMQVSLEEYRLGRAITLLHVKWCFGLTALVFFNHIP